MALSHFSHPTRLTILSWHLFVWVDLYNGVLEFSTILKGITTLPQYGYQHSQLLTHTDTHKTCRHGTPNHPSFTSMSVTSCMCMIMWMCFPTHVVVLLVNQQRTGKHKRAEYIAMESASNSTGVITN